MVRPDFIIGGTENPYLLRWWVIPRNRWFNIYPHHMLRDDDPRALHDHPWWNVSIVLKGGYMEHRAHGLPVWRRGGWQDSNSTWKEAVTRFMRFGLLS
jgi:hypothetical protein